MSDRLRIAQCVEGQGRHAEAEKLARDLLQVRSRVSGADHAGSVLCKSLIGRSLLAQKKLDEAETFLNDAWKALNAAGRKDLLADENLRAQMAELYRLKNEPEKAAQFVP
jgi:hypothetical protein